MLNTLFLSFTLCHSILLISLSHSIFLSLYLSLFIFHSLSLHFLFMFTCIQGAGHCNCPKVRSFSSFKSPTTHNSQLSLSLSHTHPFYFFVFLSLSMKCHTPKRHPSIRPRHNCSECKGERR
jgi:hypothetical protein